MACALPVVATDVGDAAVIIGDPARVVAPGDPAALAGRLLGLLALAPAGRQALGAAGRDRIVANYSIDRLADTTQAVLEGMT
jgi:glycosyltransferase involved in cell wall biosynthesis